MIIGSVRHFCSCGVSYCWRGESWIRSGSSYCSQSEPVAFFGLGAAAQAEAITLQFPDGKHERVPKVKANQLVVIEEGKVTKPVVKREVSLLFHADRSLSPAAQNFRDMLLQQPA